MTSNRVFVTGATGKVGSILVEELVKRDVQVTVYARSPEKVFKHPNVSVIQGDFQDLTPLKTGIVGHDRLFLLVMSAPNNANDVKVKASIAEIAYAAGVKQIVDLSAIRVPWRSYPLIHNPHEKSEQWIYDIPNRGGYVAIRPTNFMSGALYLLDYIKNENTVLGAADPQELQEWISPQDIAEVSANILIEPVEKHGDAAYELIGDLITPTRRAEILTAALGRPIQYKKIPVLELYDLYMKSFKNHDVAYYVATFQRSNPVYRGLPILLRREPESFEAWVAKNKQAFL
ncbi:hypothetical protein BDA99DRAFT_521389 [Phascolomyces articulosus]|uniref:NAD(P)-binding domain-containing protein n=1 Tax=Phascolomyces articulosus TaxID=60185 RepID=A0AAD5JS80_9FUNG|nr:hypothetical protein BDA99DRAFT_521389 [Phascolomyces articulosus]